MSGISAENGAPLYLSWEVLDALELSVRDVTTTIEHLIAGRARGVVWNSPKAVILPPDGRYVMGTLAVADDPPYMVMKSLITNPERSKRGLPGINASVTLSDATTGKPLAVMDGNWITAVRTAGLSAVVATRLARQDSASLALIGCGVQAHSHLKAFADLFPLTEIRAFGRGTANRDRLCIVAEQMGLRACRANSAREAVEDADLIVTTVTYPSDVKPFIDASWLSPGTFASIVDFAGSWSEQSMISFDRIVVDDMEQELASDTPLVDRKLIDGDISGLVLGNVAGRAKDNERTTFIFRGLALGDLALAALAYERAKLGKI